MPLPVYCVLNNNSSQDSSHYINITNFYSQRCILWRIPTPDSYYSISISTSPPLSNTTTHHVSPTVLPPNLPRQEKLKVNLIRLVPQSTYTNCGGEMATPKTNLGIDPVRNWNLDYQYDKVRVLDVFVLGRRAVVSITTLGIFSDAHRSAVLRCRGS